MADREQLSRLKRVNSWRGWKNNVKAWNEWRDRNPHDEIDLSDSDISGTILIGINLNRTNLTGTIPIDANLSQANLSAANLTKAKLSGANLSNSNLSGADLKEARLNWANLFRAELGMANLDNAEIGGTLFDSVDLSKVKGLDKVLHSGPSSIAVDTIYESKGNIPEVFLRGCGVPENFVTFMRSLTGKAFDFYSCFISHSAKDKTFCERVYADLQAKGVRTWYFPEDAKWGETVWGEIDRGVKKYDKLVIVLSENSLNSKPVLREVERSLQREDKEHKNILFPITLDRYVFDKWEHERKADVLEKVVGDFVGWEKDAAKYAKAFEKLLKGLQADSAKSLSKSKS